MTKGSVEGNGGFLGIAGGALLFDALGAGGHRGPRALGAEEALLDVVELGRVGFRARFSGAAAAKFEFGNGTSPLALKKEAAAGTIPAAATSG